MYCSPQDAAGTVFIIVSTVVPALWHPVACAEAMPTESPPRRGTRAKRKPKAKAAPGASASSGVDRERSRSVRTRKPGPPRLLPRTAEEMAARGPPRRTLAGRPVPTSSSCTWSQATDDSSTDDSPPQLASRPVPTPGDGCTWSHTHVDSDCTKVRIFKDGVLVCEGRVVDID